MTSLVIVTVGIKPFIRFSVFRNVDLPQPDGPMRAVMLCSGISMWIFFSS